MRELVRETARAIWDARASHFGEPAAAFVEDERWHLCVAYADAALSVAMRAAISAVESELEDGSPEYTWDDSDRATNDARRRAIEALEVLFTEPATSPTPKGQDTQKDPTP